MRQLGERIEAICEASGGTVAVAIEHVETGIRWGRLADRPFTAASLIKLPILVTSYEAVAAGRARMDEQIRWEIDDQVLGEPPAPSTSPATRSSVRWTACSRSP